MSQPASLSIGPIVGALLIAMLGCFTYKEADLSQCVRKLNMHWRSSLVTRRCKRAPHLATVNSHTGVTNIQTRRSMPMDLQRCRHPNSYFSSDVGHRMCTSRQEVARRAHSRWAYNRTSRRRLSSIRTAVHKLLNDRRHLASRPGCCVSLLRSVHDNARTG